MQREVRHSDYSVYDDAECFCSPPGHVLIRKSSVVEISHEDYALPSYAMDNTGSSPSSPNSDIRKPRWSIPWESERPHDSDMAPSRLDVAEYNVSKDIESGVDPTLAIFRQLPGLSADRGGTADEVHRTMCIEPDISQ